MQRSISDATRLERCKNTIEMGNAAMTREIELQETTLIGDEEVGKFSKQCKFRNRHRHVA